MGRVTHCCESEQQVVEVSGHTRCWRARSALQAVCFPLHLTETRAGDGPQTPPLEIAVRLEVKGRLAEGESGRGDEVSAHVASLAQCPIAVAWPCRTYNRCETRITVAASHTGRNAPNGSIADMTPQARRTYVNHGRNPAHTCVLYQSTSLMTLTLSRANKVTVTTGLTGHTAGPARVLPCHDVLMNSTRCPRTGAGAPELDLGVG